MQEYEENLLLVEVNDGLRFQDVDRMLKDIEGITGIAKVDGYSFLNNYWIFLEPGNLNEIKSVLEQLPTIKAVHLIPRRILIQ